MKMKLIIRIIVFFALTVWSSFEVYYFARNGEFYDSKPHHFNYATDGYQPYMFFMLLVYIICIIVWSALIYTDLESYFKGIQDWQRSSNVGVFGRKFFVFGLLVILAIKIIAIIFR
jgi:hypothetical protein